MPAALPALPGEMKDGGTSLPRAFCARIARNLLAFSSRSSLGCRDIRASSPAPVAGKLIAVAAHLTEECAMSARRTRPGFSLFELLVLIAILLIIGGLVLAAISRTRAAAVQTQCQNNLKQIVLAAHNCKDTYTRLPPGIGPL